MPCARAPRQVTDCSPAAVAAAADRAGGDPGDARAPAAPVPAGTAAVRAAGAVHVGRAGRRPTRATASWAVRVAAAAAAGGARRLWTRTSRGSTTRRWPAAWRPGAWSVRLDPALRPADWPRKGHEVIDVQAAHADYWKAENLDVFNGRGWVSGEASGGNQLRGVEPSSIQRWTQTLHVTLRAMKTNNVIAAGFATLPTHISTAVATGCEPGHLDDHAAARSRRQLPGRRLCPASHRRAARDRRRRLLGLADRLPGDVLATDGRRAREVVFPHVRAHTVKLQSLRRSARSVIRPPWSSARRTAAPTRWRSAWPAGRRRRTRSSASVLCVPVARLHIQREHACARRTRSRPSCSTTSSATASSSRARWRCCCGWAASPPASRPASPPAPTTGDAELGGERHRRPRVGRGLVPALRLGPFDPTPGGRAGARRQAADRRRRPYLDSSGSSWHSGRTRFPGLGTVGDAARQARRLRHRPTWCVRVPVRRGPGGAVLWCCALARATGSRPAEELLAELERALARSGRPIADGATLAALERRFRTSPEAAAYVRALRLARFGGAGRRADAGQRRALRGQLRAGPRAGRAAARGLWALPPRWQLGARGARARRRSAGLKLRTTMDDVYELFRRGTELLEAGHNHQATIPLRGRATWRRTRPRSARRWAAPCFDAQRYEQAATEFQAVIDRAPTNDYALFCLGRSPADARPPRRGAQAAGAGRVPAARPARLPRSTATAPGAAPRRGARRAAVDDA